ncbi:MAG: hypothetical protein JWO95_1039 [Verrucomicrobiales bacterium]|nr:hypothetical protein [Verrucomicrobiales bacterium]
MKNDDFEKQLQKQTLRPVPEHWRNQILHTARAAEVTASARSKDTLKREVERGWLHRLLWPCPQAWGALAAVWVVVFILNFMGAENKPVVASVQVPAREILVALKQQQQLRTELLSSSEKPVAEPPKWSAPSTRIDPQFQLIAV